MATSTTKLGLRKPDAADLVNVVTDLDANFQLIDNAAGATAFYVKTTGNYVFAITAWTLFDPSHVSDLVVKAAIGDWVEVKASGTWSNEANAAVLDVQSYVTGAPINPWGTAKSGTDIGIPSWQGVSGVITPFHGSMIKQIVAGDLDVAGNLNLKLYIRVSGSNKTLFAVADQPFKWWVKNLGQP